MIVDPRKYDVNLNTIISGFTLISTIALGGYVWANTTRDIQEVRNWQADHDKTMEVRLIENRTLRGQTEERIKSAEKVLVDAERRIDQTVYRITVLETSLATQQEQQQKVSDDLSELRGDMKVVKRILEDMQATSKRRQP